ncbi:hypothetical protein ABK040_009894 [Willaertia magna]
MGGKQTRETPPKTIILPLDKIAVIGLRGSGKSCFVNSMESHSNNTNIATLDHKLINDLLLNKIFELQEFSTDHLLRNTSSTCKFGPDVFPFIKGMIFLINRNETISLHYSLECLLNIFATYPVFHSLPVVLLLNLFETSADCLPLSCDFEKALEQALILIQTNYKK